MDGALKVLLLTALILLVSAQAFNNYRSLPDVLQKHIDKALEKANGNFGAGHHVAFNSLKNTPKTTESNLNVNVLLIVTTCTKASKNAYEHRDECYERKDKTPLIDCLVCKTKDEQELVDCGTLRDVNNKKRDNIRNNCRIHFHGGNSAFQKSKDNEKQAGCLGCI